MHSGAAFSKGWMHCEERTAAVRAAGRLARQVMAAEVSGAVDTDRQHPDVAAAARVEKAVEGLGGTPALNVCDPQSFYRFAVYWLRLRCCPHLCLMHSKDQSSPG